MRFLVLPPLALLFAACASSPTERCMELKDELDQCIGSQLSRLDCSTVSSDDIAQLSNLVQGSSCTLLSNALPVDGDLLSTTCRVMGVGCIASTTPAPVRAPARYPFVLVNGIDTSPLFRYSDRIPRMMTDVGGQRVFLATLPPYEPPSRRAPLLWKRVQEVRAQTGAAKVNLICHSLGGLDCRYLVSPGGFAADTSEAGIADSVASITTVGTAHRGTPIADVILGISPDGDQGKALNDFASLVGDWFTPDALQEDVHLRESLQALSTATAPAFNAEITDAPGIYYQSWAGYSSPFGESTAGDEEKLAQLCQPTTPDDPAPIIGPRDYMALSLVPFTDVVGKRDHDFIPNDGLTPIDSARWGNFRGCIPADHMEQLGQRNIPDVNVRTGLDIARFYTAVAADLAARGF